LKSLCSEKKSVGAQTPLPLPSVSKSVWVEYNLTQREDTSQSSIKLAILIFRLYSDFAGFSAYRGGISPPTLSMNESYNLKKKKHFEIFNYH